MIILQVQDLYKLAVLMTYACVTSAYFKRKNRVMILSEKCHMKIT